MPIWLISVLPSILKIVEVLIEKLIPSKVHPTKDFHMKKRMQEAVRKRRLLTIEAIADYGRKKYGKEE